MKNPNKDPRFLNLVPMLGYLGSRYDIPGRLQESRVVRFLLSRNRRPWERCEVAWRLEGFYGLGFRLRVEDLGEYRGSQTTLRHGVFGGARGGLYQTNEGGNPNTVRVEGSTKCLIPVWAEKDSSTPPPYKQNQRIQRVDGVDPKAVRGVKAFRFGVSGLFRELGSAEHLLYL